MNEFLVKNETTEEKFIKFYEIYMLYFDESQGAIPLLFYPDESIKNNIEKMRLIKIHPIWFLDIKEHEDFNRVDLEYEGNMYFAQKFHVKSKRKKKRAGLMEESPETIILILSISTDIDIFGAALLNKITDIVIKNFQNTLYYIIESEILKSDIIKTSVILETIKKGEIFKKKMVKLIASACKEFFESVIEQTDATSIKLQKAFSYLMLKGIKIHNIFNNKTERQLSNLRLFDSTKNNIATFQLKTPFEISNFELSQCNREMGITLKNMLSESIRDLRVKITYVKEFFEKEVFNEKIELWFPEEEILFISPTIPGINDYLLNIIENDNILITKKIELDKRI